MSEQNCNCNCNHSFTMLPVHGFGIAVDTTALQPGQPVGDCRVRVSEDLNVYVDGGRTDSGDGLSPESAVMTYDEAVQIIGRHDGGNFHNARVHFSDLAGDASYPPISVHQGHYHTFSRMELIGQSHETTKLQGITVFYGAQAHIFTLKSARMVAFSGGSLIARDTKIGIYPEHEWAPLAAEGNGVVYLVDSELHVYGSTSKNHYSVFHAFAGGCCWAKYCKIICHENVKVTYGFATFYSGSIYIWGSSFSGSVTGKKWYGYGGGSLFRNGNASDVPGSAAGVLSSNAVVI